MIIQPDKANTNNVIQPDPPKTPHQDPKNVPHDSVLGGFLRGARDVVTTAAHAALPNPLDDIAQVESAFFPQWKENTAHAVDTVANLATAPGRLSLGLVDSHMRHLNPQQTVDNTNDMIWNPSEENVIRGTNAVAHGLHVADDAGATIAADFVTDGIGHVIGRSAANAIRPYVRGGIVGGNRMALQIIADPISVAADAGTAVRATRLGQRLARAPGAGQTVARGTRAVIRQGQHLATSPAIKPLLKVAGNVIHDTATHTHALLKKHGAGPAFEHIQTSAHHVKTYAQNAHSAVRNTFVVRPELHDLGLTNEGVETRKAIEHSVDYERDTNKIKDEQAVHSIEATRQRYLEYAHAHGSPRVSAQAKNLLPPEKHIDGRPTGSAVIGSLEKGDLPVPKSYHREQYKRLEEKMFPGGVKQTKANKAAVKAKVQELMPKLQAEFVKNNPGVKKIPAAQTQEWYKRVAGKMFPEGVDVTAKNKAAVQTKYEQLRPALEAQYRRTQPTKLEQLEHMSPEERQVVFHNLRKDIHEKETIRKSKEVFEDPANKHLTKKPIDWDTVKRPPRDFLDTLTNKTTSLAAYGKAAVMYNPLAHGIKNVGTLAYLGGGLDAVARGAAAMVKPINKAMEARLGANGGGAPSYIDRNPKGVLAPLRKASNVMLEQMEMGWRAGLLEHLDSLYGPSKPGSALEYKKGALINKMLGDYKNVSNFVRFFKAIGGPFAAFHLGIIPTAVIRAIKENPDRIINALRAEYNFQHARQDSDVNQFVSGSPVEEAASALSSPIGAIKYLTSSADMGAVNDVSQMVGSFTNPEENGDPATVAMRIAAYHLIPLGVAENIYDNASGNMMPDQDMSPADHVFAEIVSWLGGRYQRTPSQRSLNRESKYIRRHGAQIQ